MISSKGVLRLIGNRRQNVQNRRDNPLAECTVIEKYPEASNIDFILKHARPGALVFSGSTRLVDRGLRFFQRPLSDGQSSLFSHISIFQGIDQDGKGWLAECDFDFREGRLVNGVVENTMDRFADAKIYPNIGIMNLPYGPNQISALHQVIETTAAGKFRYDLEIVLKAVVLSFFGGRFTQRTPVGDLDHRLNCAALVRKCLIEIGIDLCPGLDVRRTFPEDIFRSKVLHNRYLLIRESRRRRPDRRLSDQAGSALVRFAR